MRSARPALLSDVPRVLRIGLVDDHRIVREGLRDLIDVEPDMRVVGESDNGRGAVELVRTMPMDVLVLDIGMPGQSGLDAIEMIHAKAPDLAVLTLTGFPMESYGVSMLRKGASGYLNKQCDPDDILEAIRQLAKGRKFIPGALAELLLPQDDGAARARHETLGSRELQILLKLARGDTSDRIGEALSLSASTISAYRVRIMEKMGLRTNSEVTYYALKHRLID